MDIGMKANQFGKDGMMKNGNNMKTAFLITAYTGGNFQQEKIEQCKVLINSIRKYFSDAFILICDHNPINIEIQKLCDASFFDANNFNTPHGNGEKSSIIKGLKILKAFGFESCYKFNYDYEITETGIIEVCNWPKHNKLFVASRWKRGPNDQAMPMSICSAIGYWDITTALKIFDDNCLLHGHIEQWIFNK